MLHVKQWRFNRTTCLGRRLWTRKELSRETTVPALAIDSVVVHVIVHVKLLR